MLLFVYGTLKRGFGNNRLLTGLDGLKPATFISEVKTVQKYPMVAVDVAFPLLYDVPGEGHIVSGELFLVQDPALVSRLDRLEGVPHLYRRKAISVTGDGQVAEAEAYFINRPFNRGILPTCRATFDRRSY